MRDLQVDWTGKLSFVIDCKKKIIILVSPLLHLVSLQDNFRNKL